MPLFTGEYYTAREFRFTQKQAGELVGYPFLVVLDRGRQYAEHGFLLAEISKEAAHQEVIETTTLGNDIISFRYIVSYSYFVLTTVC